jgi:hypothetical protein
MITPTQVFLGLVILGGGLGIFTGLKRGRIKAPLVTNRPFVRGCLMVASAAIMLALVLGNVLRGWVAVTITGIVILLQEYVTMAIIRFRERQSRADHLMANQSLPEVNEEKTWEHVRKKGLARFVIVNTALYGLSGALLTGFAVILAPEQLPLYISISIILAGAVGGATSAVRQWNWHERQRGSVQVRPRDD